MNHDVGKAGFGHLLAFDVTFPFVSLSLSLREQRCRPKNYVHFLLAGR